MRPLAALLVLLTGAACSQTPDPPARGASRPDLYACDGCEVAAEVSPDTLDWRLVLPPPGEPGERLVVSGRVVQPDGTTPAAGVVLYLHQTNAAGRYRSLRSTAAGGPSDGMLQGWLATDAQGRYAVETVRPGGYPDTDLPAHIHIYVKEPGRRPYYIDDVTFDDDPRLTPAARRAMEGRGGPGVLVLTRGADGTWHGRRDITLEP